jgi:hypothetical protein
MARPPAMESVWTSTMSVCSRRWKGMFAGAHRIADLAHPAPARRPETSSLLFLWCRGTASGSVVISLSARDVRLISLRLESDSTVVRFSPDLLLWLSSNTMPMPALVAVGSDCSPCCHCFWKSVTSSLWFCRACWACFLAELWSDREDTRLCAFLGVGERGASSLPTPL